MVVIRGRPDLAFLLLVMQQMLNQRSARMSKKILVVDDDVLTVRLLTDKLIRAGHIVLTAATGEEAIHQAIHERPDIVIMDIMLPDMQGSEVVKELQGHLDVIRHMKIFFLSGIISQQDDRGGKIKVGQEFYSAVAKPIDFDQVFDLIN